MSRVIAVIGPILREASRELEVAGPLPPLPGDLADLQARSRSLSDAIESLSRKLAEAKTGERSIRPAQGSNRASRRARARARCRPRGSARGARRRVVLPPLAIAVASTIDQSISRSTAPRDRPRRMEECADADRRACGIVPASSGDRRLDAAQRSRASGTGPNVIAVVDSGPARRSRHEGPSRGRRCSPASPAPVAEDDARSLRMRLLVLRQQLLGGEPSLPDRPVSRRGRDRPASTR